MNSCRFLFAGRNMHVNIIRGEWIVYREASPETSKKFNTREKAIKYADKIARLESVELIIHGSDGLIKERYVYGCYDCGRQYGDKYGFPDLIIPDDIWKKISPKGNDGGLLCPSCICKRVHDLGIECNAEFRSGPFVVHNDGKLL